MRGVLLAMALGGMAMLAQDVDAQDKKEEPPKEPYTQWMSVRPWSANDKKFINPHNNIPAYWPKDDKGQPRKDKDGSQWIILGHGVHSATGPKSELTDRSGKVWLVVRVIRRETGETTLTVTPKPEEKK